MQPSSSRFFILFLIIYEFAVYISNDMILPALPTVYREFGTPVQYIPLALGLFLLGSFSIQLFGGSFSDRYGRRIAMFAGGAVVLLGNLFAIMAPHIFVFGIARLFQGMGLCFIGVAGYACLNELYDQKEAIRNMALITSITLFAPMVGPLAGSLVFLSGEWRHIFMTTFALALVGVVGLYFTMPETLHVEKRTPISLRNLVQQYGYFATNGEFLCLALTHGFNLSALMVWISYAPVLLIDRLGFNQMEFSVIQIPIFASFIAASLYLRRFIRTRSAHACFRFGLRMIEVSMIGLVASAFLPHHWYLICTLLFMASYNFGLGFASSPNNRLALEASTLGTGVTSAVFYFIVLGVASLAPFGFVVLETPSFVVFNSYIACLLLGASCSARCLNWFQRFKSPPQPPQMRNEYGS